MSRARCPRTASSPEFRRSGSRKPVIGLSVGYHDFGDYQGVGFQRPLVMAGGIPLILSRVEGTIDDQLDVVDAVVIGGGRDIEPHRYGQEPRGTGAVRSAPRRVRARPRRAGRRPGPAAARDGRGSQVVNVALGGTLVQDVSLRPEWEKHPTDRGWHRWKEVERASLNDHPDVPDHPRHAMHVEPGSRLHAALGVDEIEVNSFHHQAIETLAPGLKATGVAPDGVVEVIELERTTGTCSPPSSSSRRSGASIAASSISSASSWRPQPTGAGWA